jgi:hypothetical protein
MYIFCDVTCKSIEFIWLTMRRKNGFMWTRKLNLGALKTRIFFSSRTNTDFPRGTLFDTFAGVTGGWSKERWLTIIFCQIFYLRTDAQQNCFKRILKFTLKQLLLVSVQSPSSGSVLFELAKVIVIKIIS